MTSVVLWKVSQPSPSKRESYDGKVVTAKCACINDKAILNDNKICIPCSPQSEGCFWSFDMIRVERCSCRMDKCISLRELGNFFAFHVRKRPCVIVVELYEWRKCLSTQQSKLSSGQMHLIRGTWKFCC